jgi:type IV pilus assembly protein PilW
MTGLSIVELLIAMVLGLSLAAGVVEIYTGNDATERSRDANARIQENGRFALSYLNQELHAAGHLGCQSNTDDGNTNSTLDTPPADFQPEMGLQGWEANGTDPGDVFNSLDGVATVSSTNGSWGTSGGNVMPALQVVPGSDIVRVWNTSGDIGRLNGVTTGANPVVNISAINIVAGDVLMLNDCEHIDWVQACSVSSGASGTLNVTISSACSPGNLTSPPITANVGAEVTKLEGTVLYVGKRNNTAGNTPALFRARLGTTASPTVVEELIEGVESLQVLYGINTDEDSRNAVDTYLPADQIPAGDWGRVISVRLSLLMQSIEDSIVPAPQAYQFNGVMYDGQGANGNLPADLRLRRVFTSTISLRNRALGL